MDRHSPIRTRIPAALAAASAATVERAKHLLHDAGRIIHLPELFGRSEGPRSSSPPPVRPNERSGGDDTH
jgi:hypothetical protein